MQPRYSQPPGSSEETLEADRPRAPKTRSIPVVGLLIPLPIFAFLLVTNPVLGLALSVPFVLAAVGGAQRQPLLQKIGLVGMALMSGALLVLAGVMLMHMERTQNTTLFTGGGLTQLFGLAALAAGFPIGLSAFLLRHSEWLVEK